MKANKHNVPAEFRPLLPLARTWGIADEAERSEFLERAPLPRRRAMVSAVFPHFDAIEQWSRDQLRTTSVREEAILLNLLCAAATEAIFDVYAEQ
ncbi:MAG TPA: hypothetical protein DCY13_08260 [Verrucomicrobiales bacterium]|nr:hypothetical protein [Verrucomicrobiales bacterium]